MVDGDERIPALMCRRGIIHHRARIRMPSRRVTKAADRFAPDALAGRVNHGTASMVLAQKPTLSGIGIVLALALHAGAVLAQTAGSESAASGPVLTLDPGMHTAPIRRIAVDASARILVTTSDDKSARLWDMASGQPLATLHTPVGADQIGRLYGAAVSKEGHVAVAGTTAAPGGVHRIYLFELASRAFLRSIDARGGNIKRLEWSPDGTLLAAAYADAPALRVFDRQGALVFEETYSGDAYYLTFAPSRRLVVSVTDGQVHLYAVDGARVVADGTLRTTLNDPRGLQFSPDGSLLAVGYLSRQGAAARVDVFDVATRQGARTFTFSDLTQGNLMNVAWRSDGRALYAGGTGYRGGNRFVVKRIAWPEGGTTDIDAGANSVLDFAALRDGRVVFATAEPGWGVIDDTRIAQSVVAPTAHFYEASMLRINRNATTVSFRYRAGAEPVHFVLAQRELRDGAGTATLAAEASTFALRVSNWENDFAPTINGRALRLDPTEVARASAVLPGNAGAILGASRSLRRFDADGAERWKVPLAVEARAVVVTSDGRLLVAALLDGTLQWRRASDGGLLLTFFSTQDRRWVLWTDPGYFDVSGGAESMVGWRVNRSTGEQADFYPLSRFRDKYYRPDVVDKVLAAGDSAAALAAANRERQQLASAAPEPVRLRVEALVAPAPVLALLPPVLDLLSPAVIESSAHEAAIDYAVYSLSRAPITSFSVRVDGRPHESYTNTLPSRLDGTSPGRVVVTLPERDAKVQIFAASASGMSVPATLTWRYRAPPKPAPATAIAPAPATVSAPVTAPPPVATAPAAKPPAAPVIAPPPPVAAVSDKRPRLFLLSIGVSKYANANYNLRFAAKDARDFADTLARQHGRFYRSVEVKSVADAGATREAVREGLKWLRDVTAPDDVGMLYLAGHGINEVDDTYYFLPHDVNLDRLAATGVGEEEFRDVLTNMKGKSIFFVDTCYSGKVIGKFSNPDLTRISNRFSSPEYGVIVFSASHGRQESLESTAWGNGAFTKALVEGLVGRADFRKEGVVTHKGLDYYVSGEVKKLTAGAQTPVTTVPLGLGDFALANVLQGGE